MSWSDIKSSILGAAGELLEPHGYKLIKSRDSYEKLTPTGRLVIRLTLVASDVGNYSVRIGCGVRNDAIEDIFHRTSTVDKRCQSSTPTIIIGGDERWRLNTAEEQAVAIAGLQKYIQEAAIPFLQKAYSLQDFSDLLNTTNTDGRCPYHGSIWRCHRGLIAAKLAGDPRFEELKRQYSGFLRVTSNGFYFPEFEKCLKNIDDPVSCGCSIH